MARRSSLQVQLERQKEAYDYERAQIQKRLKYLSELEEALSLLLKAEEGDLYYTANLEVRETY